MPGIEVGVACSGGTTRAGGSAAEENGGGGAPVSSGRGGGVGELCEVEAQLMEGSAWVERLRRGGFTAASRSPAFGRSGGGVLGFAVEEVAKERGKRVAGVFVVLMCTKDRELRLYLGRATATAMWRPAVAFWARGGARRLQRKGRGRWRGQARRVEKLSKQEVASWPFHSGGRR